MTSTSASSYTLNHQADPETLVLENKSFTFHRVGSDLGWADYAKQFHGDELLGLLQNSLYRNISKYLPKYVAAFLNAQLDAKIVFGVDDDNRVTGIPIPAIALPKPAAISAAERVTHTNDPTANDPSNDPTADHSTIGSFTEPKIRHILHSVLRKYVRSTDYGISQICDQIEIRLVPVVVDHSTVLPDRLDRLLERHLVETEEWEMANQRYREAYLQWLQTIHFYKQRLVVVVCDERFRREFCDYLRVLLGVGSGSQEGVGSGSQEGVGSRPQEGVGRLSALDQSRLVRIIEIVEIQSAEIPVDPTEDIRVIQSNPDHILFWVMKFRDWKTEALSLTRPRRPVRRSDTIDMKSVFAKHVEFQKRFIDNGFCFHVIEFHIRGSRFWSKDFFFRSPKRTSRSRKQKWRYRTRVVTEDGPGCV